MLTAKAIREQIKKDYPNLKDARTIRQMIRDGKKLGTIAKAFPQISYGVEYITLVHKDGEERHLVYLNAGDTYTPTFMQNLNGNIIICSIGDYIETLSGTWQEL